MLADKRLESERVALEQMANCTPLAIEETIEFRPLEAVGTFIGLLVGAGSADLSNPAPYFSQMASSKP